jgi:hypothetical protein
MLPFQGEREEMVWLAGFRGKSSIMGGVRGPNPGPIMGKMPFWGGSKKGVFQGTPKKDRLAESPETHFSGVFRSQTRLSFCRKKV